MNPSLKKLADLAQKEQRNIIGLMSGTSLDGLDVALCRFYSSGRDTEIKLLKFETVEYSEEIKEAIRKVFAKQNIDFPYLCMLNPWLGNLHGQIILDCLQKWGISASEVDLVASHGQTVMHMPQRLHQNTFFPNSTLQIGDSDHLAVKTGIITIADFRQKHCAVGGEGAPLALYGDYLLFHSPKENRILINIGGIANFTFLPADGNFAKVFATDTGTGNTLIDAFVQKHFGLAYDKNAQIGKQGTLNERLLNELKKHKYFKQNVPKTTGPELFNLTYLQKALDAVPDQPSKEDIVNTLCHFTAQTLCDEIKKTVTFEQKTTIYLSGGGMHNPLIVDLIMTYLPNLDIKNMDDLGLSGDAKEAVLFAALANEAVAGKTGFTKPNASSEQFFMGKFSFPL